MAEPVRKTGKSWAPDHEVSGDIGEQAVLQRWVEQPDDRWKLLELPLTRELFLNPELDDKMIQGEWHDLTCREITDILVRHFRQQPDVLVVHDMKHLFGHGLSAPAPDVSFIRGIRDRSGRESFDVIQEGIRPSLVIEVVSRSLRHFDLVDKVALYESVRIPEYLIVDQPKKLPHPRYVLLGYRLDARGRYRPIEPDAEGRILSETTGLWFQISPEGDRVLLFDVQTGRRLLSSQEEEERADRETEARRVAEERAAREAEALSMAEAEIERLRAEIERLHGDR